MFDFFAVRELACVVERSHDGAILLHFDDRLYQKFEGIVTLVGEKMTDIYFVPLYFTSQHFYLFLINLLLALEIFPFLCLLILKCLYSFQRLIVSLLQENVPFP